MQRSVWFSSFLVAAGAFVLLQTQDCTLAGNARLEALELHGGSFDTPNLIQDFDGGTLFYDVFLGDEDTVLVHARAEDRDAIVEVFHDGQPVAFTWDSVALLTSIPVGTSEVAIRVSVDTGGSSPYSWTYRINMRRTSPCTEEGLRDAIAMGGGPHMFFCEEPIVTSSTLDVYKDVRIDGMGSLVVSGGGQHRVVSMSSGSVELRGMTITEGGGGYQGSAIANFGGDLTIVDSTVSNSFRGGIVSSGTLTVMNSVITDNFDAWGGGGIVLIGGTMTMSDSVVSNNTSEWYGGIGIQPTTTMATIIRSEVTGNVATVYDDGGIGLGTDTALTLIDSTVSYNRTARNGGGVGGAEADITVMGSTVVGNYAAFDSGGVGLTNGGTLVITNSTVTGNEAGHRAGGVAVGPGTVGFVTNTTVADNVAPLGPAIGTLDAITIVGSLVVGECGFLGSPPVVTNTVEGIPTGAPFESTCFGSVVVPEADLALEPLQDNGGPTWTHALLPGSAAIDAVPEAECLDVDGSPLVTDQRGTVRPSGNACDAGAFELQVQTIDHAYDFESLDQNSPTALSDEGWVIYGLVFDSSGAVKFGYGTSPAPNDTADPSPTYFSAIVAGQGGPEQGNQQLMVSNDYNCCAPSQGHFSDTDRVGSSVFQQRTISAFEAGKVFELSFDAKRGDMNDPTGTSTAFAFIQTFDLDAGYAQTNFVSVDVTNVGATWQRYSVSLGINDLLVGQLLEFGFSSTASNFEPSGVFYDNVRFAPVPMEVPEGFEATVFYDGIPGSDGIVVASGDALYVVNEFGPDGPFVVNAPRGGTYSTDDALSTIGPPLVSPDDLEAGSGEELFIADGQAQTVFKLPKTGGEPVPFVTPATTGFDSFNPFGVEVVPPSFDGPNVDPGDLIVADNAVGTDRILWAVNQETGLATVLARGAAFEGGPLGAEFGPDGTLYVAENYNASGISRVVTVASDGTVTPFVERSHRGPLAVHPNNGDVYFRCGPAELCRAAYGTTTPEPFASNVGSFQGLEFSPDGLSLFVAASGRNQVIEIRGDEATWGVP